MVWMDYVNCDTDSVTVSMTIMYKVHKNHHVMMCIGNMVNLHSFLTILTIVLLAEEIMIVSNNC